MSLRSLSVIAACVWGLVPPALAHEFWIEPQEFQVESDAPLIADIRNGQEFAGSALAYFDSNIDRFEIYRDGTPTPVPGRMGDVPALQTVADTPGLWVIIHQTTPSTLDYAKWEKFDAFATHKDFPDIRARHLARGLPETGFTETYTRYAKALVGVGSAQGADLNTGMETEFVALDNPYLSNPGAGFGVQLLYQGAPRADAQIEMFDRAPDGTVTITLYRTDADGMARLPVQSGHDYLLDGVVLRPTPEGSVAVWETLWAALSFSVP